MKLYMAPLEGITAYIFRNAYNDTVGGIDKYFTPFIVPQQKKKFKNKELQDILPDNNKGINLVPQILTNKSEDFIRSAGNIAELGYNEVNLNLGCPSGTVVSKYKGSGFLTLTDDLDRFLDDIYSRLDLKISIKTRIGRFNSDEFVELLEIFNKYPVSELIIHPRIQTDYYKNVPNIDAFRYGYDNSKNSICYNGDIFTEHDYMKLMTDFPKLDKVMLGRGIIANPELTRDIIKCNNQDKSLNMDENTMNKDNSRLKLETLRKLHNRVYEDYREVLSGDVNVLYKMKELWFYFMWNIEGYEKEAKIIRKTDKRSEYESAVRRILQL